MRISDWSSDVCSSDLQTPGERREKGQGTMQGHSLSLFRFGIGGRRGERAKRPPGGRGLSGPALPVGPRSPSLGQGEDGQGAARSEERRVGTEGGSKC